MCNQDDSCPNPADCIAASRKTPSHIADAVGQPLAPTFSQLPGLGHNPQYTTSQSQFRRSITNSGNQRLAGSKSSQDARVEAQSLNPCLPVQRDPEFRHPLTSLIPTINCLPSAFLDSSSTFASNSTEMSQPDRAGQPGSGYNLQPHQQARSDGFLQGQRHRVGYESSEDEFSRSPGGRRHVDTLSDGPYLFTASRESFQGVPRCSHFAANKARSPTTVGGKQALPTTVRPLQPSTSSQSTALNTNGQVDIPRGMKVLMTTLKDAIYDATSPSKQRLYAERFKNSASSAPQKNPERKRRGAESQQVPGEYSWWEKNSDDSDSTVNLDDLDRDDPTIKAIEVFRRGQAKQWQTELQELQWEKHTIEQKSSGPPSEKKAWEKDMLLRTIKKQIQAKLQNGHVLVLQKLPPAALKLKVTTCAHPFCPYPKACSPAGSYRLSLEPVENLDDAKVPTLSLAEVEKGTGRISRPTKAQKGQAANGAVWYCLTCLEGLWNGVGQITDDISRKQRSNAGLTQTARKRSKVASSKPSTTGHVPGSQNGSVKSSFLSTQQTPPPEELPELSNSQGTLQSTLSERETNFGLDGTNDDLILKTERYRGPLSDIIMKAAEQAGCMVSTKEKRNAELIFTAPKKLESGVRAGSAPITPSKVRTSVEDSVSPRLPEAYVYSTRSTPEGRLLASPSRKRRASSSGDLQPRTLDSGYITGELSPVELADDKVELPLYPRNCETLSHRLERQRDTNKILRAVKDLDAGRAAKRQKVFASFIKMQRRKPNATPAETKAFEAAKISTAGNNKFKSQLKRIPDYYCTCHKPDDGKKMIKCCNEICLYGWFHLACTGLSSVPDNDVIWYCAACSTVLPKPSTVLRVPNPDDNATTSEQLGLALSTFHPIESEGVSNTPDKPTENPICSQVTNRTHHSTAYKTDFRAMNSKNTRSQPQIWTYDSEHASELPYKAFEDLHRPQAINLDGAYDSAIDLTEKTGTPRQRSRPTSRQPNPRKRRHTPSPHPPNPSKHLAAQRPTPFARDLSSFIYPETRSHSSGYYTLSAPQSHALQKWKTTLQRQQMFETPRNRAFLAKNGLLHKYDETDPYTPLESIEKSEDAPKRGVMEIGGLVVEVNASEVRNRDLSTVLRGVDERVERELGRLGYVDRPYKGGLTLKIGKRVEEEGGKVVVGSSGDEETSESGSTSGEALRKGVNLY